MNEDTKSALRKAYQELGQAYYEGAFEDPLPQLLPYFDEITRLRNQGQSGNGVCPKCGTVNGKGAKFCCKCGAQLS